MGYSGSGSVITYTGTGPGNTPDAYAADVAGGWGIITKQGDGQYLIDGKIEIGDDIITTEWEDENIQVEFTSGSNFTRGYVTTDNTTTVMTGVSITMSGGNQIAFRGDGGTSTLNSCLLSSRTNEGTGFGTFGTTTGTICANEVTVDGFQDGAKLTSINGTGHWDNVTITNCVRYGVLLYRNLTTANNIFIKNHQGTGNVNGAFKFYSGNGNPIEVTGLLIVNSAGNDITCGDANSTLNIINSIDINQNKIYLAVVSSAVNEKRTFNRNVYKWNSDGWEDADVSFTDAESDNTTVQTDANGDIAEQTFTINEYTGPGAQKTTRIPYTINVSKTGCIEQPNESHNLADTAGIMDTYYLAALGDQTNPTFNDETLAAADQGDDRIKLTIPAGTSNCGVSGVRYPVYMKKDSAPTAGTVGALETADLLCITDENTLYVAIDTAGAKLITGTWYFKVLCVDQVGNIAGGSTTVSVSFTRAEIISPGFVPDARVAKRLEVPWVSTG